MSEVPQKVTKAFTRMKVAEAALKQAREILTEFGMEVPSLSGESVKMMADSTNAIEFSNNFIRSFIRMSVLKQVVAEPPEEPAEE